MIESNPSIPDRRPRCRIIAVPRFTDSRGTLAAIDGSVLPFEPKRLYYIYDLPVGARRAQHAHKSEEELIIALAGSFKVLVDDGKSKTTFQLDRRDCALYVPPLIWHELSSFGPGSVCAVLASQTYNPEDYYQIYEEFLQAVRNLP